MSLLVHPPWHLPRLMQRILALRHLQFPLQATEHPHCSSTEQPWLASGRSVQKGIHIWISHSTPTPIYLDQKSLASWQVIASKKILRWGGQALHVETMHALLVGWSRGISDFVWRVVSWLHWLSLNCSFCYTLILWNVPGVLYGLGRDREFRGLPKTQCKCLWGVDMKVMHSMLSFFLIPNMNEVTSHPVNAWNNRRDWQRRGPSCSHITWIGISLKCFPVPMPTHNSAKSSWLKWSMARTTTSVSTVLIYVFLWPFCAAWFKCSISLVSASSCWLGARFVISVCLLLRTDSALVVRRRYLELWGVSMRLVTEKFEQGILVGRVIQKLLPFWSFWERDVGGDLCSTTSSFATVDACLWFETRNVSHTASTRVQHSVNWLSENGNNCICVYSPKSDARWGFTMWMIAAISNSTSVDSIKASLHPGLGIADRQFRSVDLVPDINFQWLDKAGGSRGFSWWKNSSMSASGLAFRERNSLVSTVFDIADPSFLTLFFKSAGGLLLNVYSLTLGITSDKGFLLLFYSLWNEFPEHSLTNILSVPPAVSFRSLILCSWLWSRDIKDNFLLPRWTFHP